VKIVFFGTPLFAAKILEFLLEKKLVLQALVTQPDRPRGRKLIPTSSATKLLIENLRVPIPIFQPEKASDSEFLRCLEQLQADLYVVVAYGQILSKKLLAIPPLGCINVHASLLPRYRGAAPMQRCLMDGCTETGVCIQKMVYQLDAGDILAEARVQVGLDETLGELEEKLCESSKPLLFDVLQKYTHGIPEGKRQDETQATYAAKITAEEMLLDWNLSAQVLHNRIRAVSPRPGAWCWVEIQGVRKRLKVLRSKVVAEGVGMPGTVSRLNNGEFIVATGSGALLLEEVQPEGKRAMEAADWMRGCAHIPQFTDVQK
jgi:methionyl-tRNA formyltransferase